MRPGVPTRVTQPGTLLPLAPALPGSKRYLIGGERGEPKSRQRVLS